jgi:hypothetical protein
MADPVTIKLAKPITAHGETLNELKLRAPTVAEMRVSGQPYRVLPNGVQADYAACAQLLQVICAIPPSAVNQLDASDFDEAAMVLVGFTMPRPKADAAPSP